eukprot:COSAG03_NODE_2395_length_2812_cov_2.315518_1_plen_91_part_10
MCTPSVPDHADLNKLEKSNCYKMVQSACTHHNFTCFLVSHSLTQLIPRLRRACDIMVLWPPTTAYYRGQRSGPVFSSYVRPTTATTAVCVR